VLQLRARRAAVERGGDARVGDRMINVWRGTAYGICAGSGAAGSGCAGSGAGGTSSARAVPAPPAASASAAARQVRGRTNIKRARAWR
jgi:hypothetical protein